MRTGTNTQYLGIYYYNANDSIDEDVIRANIRVDIGDKPSSGYVYTPTNDVKVNSIYYTDKKTIYVGDEMLTGDADSIQSGWSGSKTEGYTCATNSNGKRLGFYKAFVGDAVYIVEFDTDYTGGEFVKVYFEDGEPTLVYNGETHIIIPVRATSGSPRNLYFESCTDVSFTITNVSCKKVNLEGTPIELSVYTTENINNKDNLGFWNVILGKNTATRALGSTRMIAIGNNALMLLRSGHRNIGIGTWAMSQMRYGENNVSIGADSMLAMQKAVDNVAIGRGAMYDGANTEKNVAIGRDALHGASDSTALYNVAIGGNSAIKFKKHRLVAVGYQAGYNEVNGYGNTLLGFDVRGQASGYDNTCIGKNANYTEDKHNSTAIGANAQATKSNQVVLGDSNVNELVFGNKKINFNDDGTVTWETIS